MPFAKKIGLSKPTIQSVIPAFLLGCKTVCSAWFTLESHTQGTFRHLPPAPLFACAVGGVFGILSEDSLQIRGVILVVGLLLAIILNWKRKTPASFRLGLLCFWIFALLHHSSDTLSPNRIPTVLKNSNQPITVSLEGIVCDPPTISIAQSKFQRSRFRLRLTQPSQPALLKQDCILLAQWAGTPPALGDTVRLRVAARPIPPPRNPGQFDLAASQRRQTIWMEAFVHDPLDTEIISHHQQYSWTTFSNRCSERISEELRRGIEDRPQTHALISSMILGVHGEGLMEAKPAFRDTGTLHLFAVSGLNLSMLAGFLGAMLTLARFPQSLSAWLIIPILILYGVATGLGPSCVRAMFMSLFILAAPFMKRPSVALNSLGTAALLLFIIDTNTLFGAGFQLSFGLVLALAVATRPITAIFERAVKPDSLLPRKLWSLNQERLVRFWNPIASAGATTAVAWTAGLPWNITLFHQLTPVALVANLIAIPIAFVSMALGFLALIAAPLGPVTPTLNRINATCAECLFSFVQWASQLPGGRFPISPPFQTSPTFVSFDLPGGASILIQAHHQLALLDCGTNAQAKAIVIPGLQSLGFPSLDTLFLSHGSSKFIGGAIAAFEELHPHRIIETELKDRSRTRREFHEWLAAFHHAIEAKHSGDALPLSASSHFEILHPPPFHPSTIADNQCLVTRFKNDSFSVLYTASAGFPTERWLLENRKIQLSADVWIRAWHSREITGSDDFVRAIHPKVIVVTSNLMVRDQTELAAWANRWRAEGITVFLQQDCGAVFGEKQGHNFHVRSMLGTENRSWPIH